MSLRKQRVRVVGSCSRASLPPVPHPLSRVALQTNQAAFYFKGTCPSVWAAGQMVGDACHALVLQILKKCSDVFLGLRIRAGYFVSSVKLYFGEVIF